MTDLLEAINIIREKSESGKLIIFVGSGVSCNVKGAPSWNDLVVAMANEVRYSKCDMCKQKVDKCEESCKLKYSYSNDEYLKIPQYLYNQDKEKYYRIISEQFKNIKDAHKAPLSSAIFDLNPVHIITTNYDNLLESSSNELCSQYNVIIEDKDLLASNSNKYIIKMHGDINDKSTIVLKEQDYLEFSQRRVLIELFVKALLTNHTILFLGYSLNDYNIKLIISWLNFMRQQNDALKDKNIGYIALDEESISDMQQTYFEKNYISVLNLRQMPIVENDSDLSEDAGQRLYSFLKVIHNLSLESTFDYAKFISSVAKKINGINFIPYNSLLKLLHITKLGRYDETLFLNTEEDFNRLKQIFESDDINSKLVKQFMVDNGIRFIDCLNENNLKLAATESSTLFSDELYNCYLNNNYTALMELLKNEQNVFKKAFYQHFISYYTMQMFDSIKEISFHEASTNTKLIYLYNSAILNMFGFHQLNLLKLSNYLDNIPSTEKQTLYTLFKQITDGFKDKKIYMKDKLEELKTIYLDTSVYTNNSLVELFNIKTVALEVYNFYFYNTLFCEHRADIKEVMSIYIEAILCTNGTYKDKKANSEFESKNKKYSIDFMDWDIMTKFISTKSLISLIYKFQVKELSLNISNEFIFEAFKNLIDSIEYAFFKSPIWSTLTNFIVLISYLNITDEEKDTIERLIETLLLNDKFNNFFLSVNFPDFRKCLYHLGILCQKVFSKNHIEIFEKILALENFYDYMINNEYDLRSLLHSLIIYSDNLELQEKLFNLCMTQQDIPKKIKLIWLVYKKILEEKYKKKIKDFLNRHSTYINYRYLIQFISSDLIDFNKEKIDKIINDIIKLDEEQYQNCDRHFSDPLEGKLGVLYILIVQNKITNINDISALDKINKKPIHIEFLLSQENFDYSKVDFSDYMWQYFTKREDFLAKFIDEKEQIMPKIKERLNIDAATDFEKRMLYGYFLDKKDLL